MASSISPLAVVDSHAEIAEDVTIGPFCVVGPEVRIGPGCELYSHVTITGRSVIGAYNRIFPGVVIGADPQDLTYMGDNTAVVIGDHNVFREGVTVNRATTKESGVTTLGSHSYFMACCHVAHDCRIGSRVLMANCVLLGGHTHVHDHAILSGNVAVHHWTTIGSYAFVGGLSRIVHDVPPFMLVDGNPSSVRTVNRVGLKRHGFTPEEIDALNEAHRIVYRAHMGLPHAQEILKGHDHLTPHVQQLLDFVQRQRDGLQGRQRQPRKAGPEGSSQAA